MTLILPLIYIHEHVVLRYRFSNIPHENRGIPKGR